jgi:hypothetical protein
VPFSAGKSGNPAGRKRGAPNLLTRRIREVVERDAIQIVKAIIRDAKVSDVAARQQFLKYLLPHPRLNLTAVDLPPAKDAAEAQAQIGELVSMAAKGELDLDALQALSRSLAMAIDVPSFTAIPSLRL